MRPLPAPFGGALRQRCGNVEPGKRISGQRDLRLASQGGLDKILQMRGLGHQRMGTRLRDPPGLFMQVDRIETHHARQRLAMREAAVRLHQWIGGACGHFDMIAKHAIVPNFQRCDAGALAIACLQSSDRPPSVACHPPQFVQSRIVAVSNISAVGRLGRRAGDQCPREAVHQCSVAIEGWQQLLEQRRLIRQSPKSFAQHARFIEPVAQLSQIAWTAPAHGDAPQRTPYVGKRS